MILPEDDRNLFRDVLIEQLPRDFVEAAREAFYSAAALAHKHIEDMLLLDSQIPSARGQIRFFQNLRVFTNLFESHGSLEKIAGASRIVTGRINNIILTPATIGPKSERPRYSTQRGSLAMRNAPFSIFHNGELFDRRLEVYELAVWLVVKYSASYLDRPYDIKVVVPYEDGREWLYEISIDELLRFYDEGPVSQADNAFPRIKEAVRRQRRSSE
ncbi:hypothetical protein PT277_01510 [Acetobacteraceae bacterium ESL0709]|nr:hypothetical protein [Acetobacteraceae bacterium ESL0697]MDF7677378.1 hypothetical protein [Acetobacteraceae bacterium ESL0709]